LTGPDPDPAAVRGATGASYAATSTKKDARSQRLRNSVASSAQAFAHANLGAIEAHLTLVSTANAVTSGLRAHIASAGFDLTPSRFTLLRLLYLTPEMRLPQNEIAQQMAVSPANVTQLIDVLERENWVQRVLSPIDRRVTYAELTVQGREQCGRLVPAMVEYIEDSCGMLTQEEIDQFIALLNKVRTNLKPSA
jgi:MarR family transcriptional regulator, 2-MHQ and catechol-resistance regulon repressor